MKCQKYEKWISDVLDGMLSRKKKNILEDHLAQCPACRVYQKHLIRIKEESWRLEKTKVLPSYWEEFSRSLEKSLRAFESEKETLRPFRLSWKWAWVGMPLLFVLALSLVFFLSRGQAPENDIFFYEACLHRLHQEIGDDAKLEDNFNRVILGSLREGFRSAVLEENSFLSEDLFFWESLNEEELEFIEQEIKKEMKS